MSDNFVDLTPIGAGQKRMVRLTPEEERDIQENNRGLTKEGCMVKIQEWANSNNFHQLVHYLAMYKLCKNLVPSQTWDDGCVLLSKNMHTTKQGIKRYHELKEKIGHKNRNGEYIIAKDMAELKGFVEERLGDLRFITNKGA